LAAIAMLVLQASLRYRGTCPSRKIRSSAAEVQIGNMIFCRRMKEYDA
jgi:hypothetical protein